MLVPAAQSVFRQALLVVAETVLITGGAGFIGSHLADELLPAGYRVRALDSLVEQVHGSAQQRPAYLDEEIELIPGDVRSPEVVRGALEGVDAVFHLAARVGVGQSMYEPAEYAAVNTTGTGVLLEALLEHPVRKLVVASSMSVYGEGAYEPAPAVPRTREQLERGEWEPRGPSGEELTAVPTPETKEPSLASVYALTKYDQERMCLLYGDAYGVPTVALRFFNVYGPRQALSNPYTGVGAIFASRLLNGRPPLVFEDGLQTRDFVDVRDITRGVHLALTNPGADGETVNLGTGKATNLLELADVLSRGLGVDIEPDIVGQFRAGDIRHCYADTRKAADLLGFRSQIDFESGVQDLLTWIEGQEASDQVDAAHEALTARGLAR
jgi:dTDP-L-rhamnose 4-epimerase